MNQPSHHNENHIPKSSYAIIPSYILDDNDLEEGAKTLYARISMYSEDGRCWASNQHFADKQKVTTRCIQNWLKQLKDKEYIYIEVELGTFQTKRNIWITNDFKKCYKERTLVHPPANLGSPPPDSQFVHTNTSITNTNTGVVCSDDALVAPIASNDQKANSSLNTHCFKQNAAGGSFRVSLEDVFSQAVLLRKNWTAEEIHKAWKILHDYKYSIREPLAFIEGVIKKLRKSKQNDAITKKQKGKSCTTQNSNQENKQQSESNVNSMVRDTPNQAWLDSLSKMGLYKPSTDS